MPEPVFVYAHLNARVQPLSRGEIYEDPLMEALAANGYGEVTGGGTMQLPSGEIEYCGIDIDLTDLEKGIPLICDVLTGRGAPKGSKLQYKLNGKAVEVHFGKAEGLALYLNGTDLPDSVYQECDSNFVVDSISELLNGIGAYYDYWQGPRETALYLYGRSAQEMKERIAPFLAEYPLCQKSRLEVIA